MSSSRTKQICFPARPVITDVELAHCGVYLSDGWFYQIWRVTKKFGDQEVYLRKQVLIDEPGAEEDETREIEERMPDYSTPPAISWHAQRCRAIPDEPKYSYKGLVATLSSLRDTFPKVSLAELTTIPFRTFRPNESWQGVAWNHNFDKWVSENMSLPFGERRPPVIEKTLIPEYSLAAARQGGKAQTLARKRPLPFLDDKHN